MECPDAPFRFAAFPDDAAPLNSRFYLGERSVDEPEPVVVLMDLIAYAPLPGTLSSLDADRVRAWFFTPDAPLPPLTELSLSVDGYVDLITSGEAEDLAAPTGGLLLHAEAHQIDRSAKNACPQGLQRSMTLSMSPGQDEGSLALYELELQDEAGEQRFLFQRSVAWLGEGDCLNNLSWTPGQNFQLRTRAVDYAGNPGPWSETLEIGTPRCASARPGGLWLLLLILWRRFE